MTRQPVGLFDGFTNAERDDMLYGYFSAASEVGGHLPQVRGFAEDLRPAPQTPGVHVQRGRGPDKRPPD